MSIERAMPGRNEGSWVLSTVLPKLWRPSRQTNKACCNSIAWSGSMETNNCIMTNIACPGENILASLGKHCMKESWFSRVARDIDIPDLSSMGTRMWVRSCIPGTSFPFHVPGTISLLKPYKTIILRFRFMFLIPMLWKHWLLCVWHDAAALSVEFEGPPGQQEVRSTMGWLERSFFFFNWDTWHAAWIEGVASKARLIISHTSHLRQNLKGLSTS